MQNRTEIANVFRRNLTEKQICRNFKAINDLKPLAGLTLINEYFIECRLLTRRKRGALYINFFNFVDMYNEVYSKKSGIQKLYNKLRAKYGEEVLTFHDNIKILKQIYNLHITNITVFKPTNAANIINSLCYKPNHILNPFCGYGGIMLAAAAQHINITCIDSNLELVEPYRRLIYALESNKLIHSNINMIYDDVLTMDYNIIDPYDTVVFSPPYYDIEIYDNQPHIFKTRTKWIDNFYVPIIHKLIEKLAPHGAICINVPHKIYLELVQHAFGGVCATEQIEYTKFRTLRGGAATEYTYIWYKSLLWGEGGTN